MKYWVVWRKQSHCWTWRHYHSWGQMGILHIMAINERRMIVATGALLVLLILGIKLCMQFWSQVKLLKCNIKSIYISSINIHPTGYMCHPMDPFFFFFTYFRMHFHKIFKSKRSIHHTARTRGKEMKWKQGTCVFHNSSSMRQEA